MQVRLWAAGSTKIGDRRSGWNRGEGSAPLSLKTNNVSVGRENIRRITMVDATDDPSDEKFIRLMCVVVVQPLGRVSMLLLL